MDAIVVGGDIAAGPPQPREVVELVRSLPNAHVIRGNADRLFADEYTGDDGLDWLLERLEDDQASWLAGLPFSVVLDDTLYVHAAPHDDRTIVTELTTDEKLAGLLREVEQRRVVAGHTHMQLERRVGETLFVNAGSVGWPYEGRPGRLLGDPRRGGRAAADRVRPRAHGRARPRLGPSAGGGDRGREHPGLGAASRGARRLRRMTELVNVGRVGKPHGLDGSFFVEHASEDEARFAKGATLHVDGEPAKVVASKRSRGRPVIRLDREPPRGAELDGSARSSCRRPARTSTTSSSCSGLEAVEEGGRPLGRVTALHPGPANDALELDTGLLLPLVAACVQEVDLEAGRIQVARGFADPS